jgi:apolipoprotein N-acyltransferase
MAAAGGEEEPTRRFRWGLPVASGLLLVACFPPFRLAAAPFLALVPLVVCLAGIDPGDSRTGARVGLVAGLVGWGVLLYWIPLTLSSVTVWAPALYVVLAAALAAFVGLFGAAVVQLTGQCRLPLWIAVPIAWTGAEWLRAHLGPLSFPWLELGTSFWHSPTLAGPAELVGVRGLSFQAALVTGLVATALLESGRRRAVSAATAVLLVTVPALWSVRRQATLVLEPLAVVAVVQPDVSRSDRASGRATTSGLERLEALSPEGASSVDLVVWPEAVFTEDPRTDPALASRVQALVDRAGVPALFGAYLEREGPGRSGVTFNGVLAWLPGQGDAGWAYRKRRLVPGVEAVPFINPDRPGMENRFAAFGRGSEVGVLALDGIPALSPLICYESIFSRDGRAGARAGGRAVVNLTNDAWFAGPDGDPVTAAFAQHPAHLVLRAVELRQGAVRAANTGLSLFIDPLGRIQARAPTFSPAVLVDTVYTTEGPTLFVRAGDWLGGASAIVLVLGLLLGTGSRRARIPWWRDGPTR